MKLERQRQTYMPTCLPRGHLLPQCSQPPEQAEGTGKTHASQWLMASDWDRTPQAKTYCLYCINTLHRLHWRFQAPVEIMALCNCFCAQTGMAHHWLLQSPRQAGEAEKNMIKNQTCRQTCNYFWAILAAKPRTERGPWNPNSMLYSLVFNNSQSYLFAAILLSAN